MGREWPRAGVFGSERAASGPIGWPLPGPSVGSLRPAFTPEHSAKDFPLFPNQRLGMSPHFLAGLVLFQRGGLTCFISNSLWLQPCPSESCPPSCPAQSPVLWIRPSAGTGSGVPRAGGWGSAVSRSARPLARLRFQIILDAQGVSLDPHFLHPNSHIDHRGALWAWRLPPHPKGAPAWSP